MERSANMAQPMSDDHVKVDVGSTWMVGEGGGDVAIVRHEPDACELHPVPRAPKKRQRSRHALQFFVGRKVCSTKCGQQPRWPSQVATTPWDRRRRTTTSRTPQLRVFDVDYESGRSAPSRWIPALGPAFGLNFSFPTYLFCPKTRTPA